jgi:hypothetical protein
MLVLYAEWLRWLYRLAILAMLAVYEGKVFWLAKLAGWLSWQSECYG